LSNSPFAGLLDLSRDGAGSIGDDFLGAVFFYQLGLFGGASGGGNRGVDGARQGGRIQTDGGGAGAGDKKAVGESEVEARRRGRFAEFRGGR